MKRILCCLCVFVVCAVSGASQADAEVSASFGEGTVIIGWDNRTCDSSLEGVIRFNSSGGGTSCDTTDLPRIVVPVPELVTGLVSMR